MFTHRSITYGFNPPSSLTNNLPHSNLSPPNILEVNSRSNQVVNHCSNTYYHQPILNPHQHFLHRNSSNCPLNLTQSKRTKWLKTGRKAQENQQLLNNYEHFSWPIDNYGEPIHIHRLTSSLLLQGLTYKLSNVHLFSIDTESDRPTRKNPNSIPALIQVQAIIDKQQSTVLLLEVQHLPPRSSYLFQSIRTLCRQIFSSMNTFIAWGDIQHELRAFEQFDLFDPNQLIHTIDFQRQFTDYWNITHPHTSECLHQHQQSDVEHESDDVLICLINNTDLDADAQQSNEQIENFDDCICPDTIRPYKTQNAVWSLQKAIQFIFHQALDKSMTMNLWSCGIDLYLRTWRTSQDQEARHALLMYAMNDVFATTTLYNYVQDHPSSIQQRTLSIQLNTIQPASTPTLPTIFLFSDSHGKYFPPNSHSTKYCYTTKSISGLQWYNSNHPNLAVHSLINSTSIRSLLVSCYGVVFLVGTNSVRITPATIIIDQITTIIDLLRQQHSHLTRKNRIIIISSFPCFKPSTLFPTIHLLMANVDQYNVMLLDLSISKGFTFLTIPISIDHLHSDQMHIEIQHIPYIYNYIQHSLDLLLSNSNTSRSLVARHRRNHQRHEKLRLRQASQTVIRPISPRWKLHDLKAYLKFRNIRCYRLPEIRKHRLRLQFTHSTDRDHAEQTLHLDEFSDQNYHTWISMQQ